MQKEQAGEGKGSKFVDIIIVIKISIVKAPLGNKLQSDIENTTSGMKVERNFNRVSPSSLVCECGLTVPQPYRHTEFFFKETLIQSLSLVQTVYLQKKESIILFLENLKIFAITILGAIYLSLGNPHK